MTRFKATVSEDVEANRLMVKSVSEGLIGLSIAQPGDTPEFRSTGKLLEGQEVTVTIKGANSWNIEAGGDKIGRASCRERVELAEGGVRQEGDGGARCVG